MGRVAESLMEEIETVARLSNEEPADVHKEWKAAEKEGTSFSTFIVGKSRKQAKGRRI